MGSVAIAQGSELPAIVGMIRSYGDMCQRQALDKMSPVCSREEMSDIITSLIWGGCVDEVVMKELAGLHTTCPDFVTTCPDFVVRCSAQILCLSDSRFAGALRSGLLATALSICAQLGHQEIRIPMNPTNAGVESVLRADALASGIIDQLYKIRLHQDSQSAWVDGTIELPGVG